MTNDFKTGDVIIQVLHYDQNKARGPYTVDDPVRTSTGKLRLIGPRGGKLTTWWRKDSTQRAYSLEVRS
jgi:hypothetical protein